MNRSMLTGTLACLAMGTLSQAVHAQAARGDGWQVPRNSAGHPVLQGHWTSSTIVPLERPVELGDRAFYTEDEVASLLAARLVVEETEFGTQEDVHYQLADFGLDLSQNPIASSLRTSIVTNPANGRLPEITAAARALAEPRAAYRRAHGFDSAQDRPLAERCIVWSNEGPPMLPIGYNSNYQIVQTEDHVVVLLEMIHDARIIPFDGRAEDAARVPQWLGSSRGRWEGETLVVETTGFTGRTNVRGMSPDVPISPDGRVTERFTRTAEDTLRYEFTVDDPATWVQPWSGEYPLTRIEGPMFEYACHEGNYGLANNLSGARADERSAAAERR